MSRFEPLRRHVPRALPVGRATEAAVLVPVCMGHEGEQVLFIKRAAAPDAHGGQFAFPGGRREPEDADLVATALREAWEEVGLLPEHVEVLGQLDAQVTPTGFHITPVVGRVPWPYALELNPVEVDRVIQVPLARLLEPGYIRLAEVPLAGGRVVSSYVFELGADVIWGATARITLQLVELLAGRAVGPHAPDLPPAR